MPNVTTTTSRIAQQAAAAIRAAIRLAGGREVCFVCAMDEEGAIQSARVVARGDVQSVLALPGFARRGELLLHNHPSGVLEPSGADMDIAARMHDAGIGFAITDNDARELYVVVEVPHARELAFLDLTAIDHDLGPAGPIARGLPRYEDRDSQRAYARAIARLYNSGGIGLFEAGTGVGKSLGYLVPALRWAAANGERTVVSTNTINLQEQLVGKDLPGIAAAFGDQPVRFALLKGWRNYVCLHRLDHAMSIGGSLFEPHVAEELQTIADWAKQTPNGSLSDLAVAPRDEVWDEVAAESDLCGRLQCAHFSKCFLFAARREAAQADVLVANHHLLLADLAVRRASHNWDDAAVLPPYARLIVDEGHHLEDAAAAHLGASISARGLQRIFARLERRGKGLLPTLRQRLSGAKDLLSVASLDHVEGRLAPALRAAREKADMLFSLLDTVLVGAETTMLRLTSEFDTHPVWEWGLDVALTDLSREIDLLGEGLRLIRERLDADEKTAANHVALLNEMGGATRRLENARDALHGTLRPAPNAPATVRWIEARGKERNIAATTVPLDLAPILREDLFRRVDTAIVTSATLTADRRFAFLANRLGLNEADVEPEVGVFPSPFRYQDQALLALPTDGPAPNVDPQGHFELVLRCAADVATAADGGMFVLFTSHRDVRAAAEALRALGANARWPLLVHGEDQRDTLLRRFRGDGRAILLGTSSFWEGVDVPGDALRAIVLARLPFRVPTEPLVAAHAEAVEARGGDAFRDYMLPHAALRLKQGFGRLIRSHADRGVVVLCDSRAISKGYGEELLDALPPARRAVGRWSEIRRDVIAMFQRQER
ncbi:MAG TPA: helicase C-terminal domain-containing protein [Gemmatimonadaceae bacterium]|nr:helicase C-terminal domain-containing protein [Gemmatimonadaceae bacterium]